MKLLTVEQLQIYWSLVEPEEEPKPMLEEVEMAKWGKLYDKDQSKGTRQLGTRKRHGVVRRVEKAGNIEEFSCKDGQLHGMSRLITALDVRIWLYKNNETISYFRFDHEFVETHRNDAEMHLVKMTPEEFKLSEEEE